MKALTKRTTKDWRQTDIGWKGFFQGYATAEADAHVRANARFKYVVTNLRSMVRSGKTSKDMLEFLERIEA